MTNGLTRILLFASIAISISLSAQVIRVPRGRSILVDGKISPGEWTDAAKFDLGQGAQFLAKLHEDYLLFAVIFPKDTSGFVDLFLSTDSDHFFDLHASAKLGERATVAQYNWPDWEWWNNRDWTANVSRVESFDEKKFLAENVREFQIKRARFPGSELRARLVLSINHGQSYTELHLPQGKTDKEPEQWLILRF